MTSKTPIAQLASVLEAIPSEYASYLNVGDLRALVRLSIAPEAARSSYLPIVDSPRLCNMSKGRFRFVKLLANEERNLEAFSLTEEGLRLITSLSRGI